MKRAALRERLRPAPGRWTRLDTIMVSCITLAGGALRFAGIRRGRAVWDETIYVPDACLYVRGSRGACGVTSEVSTVHPPLAKWLIGASIRVIGNTPLGWRFVPLVVGTLSIAVLYLLGRRLYGSTLVASLAAGLMAIDFLHFVMSRTAMLDIFVVFFALTMFLCFVYDRDAYGRENAGGSFFRRLRARPWLLAAGLAGGATVASKWSGVYLLGAVAVLVCAQAVATRRGTPDPIRRAARSDGLIIAVALVIIPLAVYVATYAGRLHGSLIAAPWSDGSWVHAFVARQREMYDHHRSGLYATPFNSPAWSWLLVKRPVVFDFVNLGGGRYQEVLALGNPLVWWAGIAGILASGWYWFRHRVLEGPETVVLAGFLAGYLPWFIVSRREAFLYYVLPALPFMYLALAGTVARVRVPRVRTAAIVAVAAVTLGMFVFYRPILTGETLKYRQWEARMLFKKCGQRAADGRRQPVMQPGASPAPGWCWV